MMKVVSWNCRGLGSREEKEEVRKIIRAKKTLILILQETKLREKEALQDMQGIWKKEMEKP
jgi:exonuclease III